VEFQATAVPAQALVMGDIRLKAIVEDSTVAEEGEVEVAGEGKLILHLDLPHLTCCMIVK